MKTFEITKEQILEMASCKCSKYMESAKKWFPEAFEQELKVGEWNFIDCGAYNYIFFVEKIENNNIYGYGFDEKNEYYNFNKLCDLNDIVNSRRATPQEVETALKAEAVKRGYKEGVVCEFGIAKSLREIKTNKMNYDEKTNSLDMGNDIIFYNGQWATIIETITKEEAEKLLNKRICN